MNFLLNFLFPRTCLGCGKIGLPAEASAKAGHYFCPFCIQKINLIENQICPVCEKSSPFGQTHRVCQKNRSLDGLISFFAYEGMVKKAIHQLKFKYVTDLADELFGLVRETWEMGEGNRFSQMKRFVKDKKPTIVPVPLYWYKENQRGFNQAEIFAQNLANSWNLEVKNDLLIRKKSTIPQAGLSEKERQKNIANAFVLSPNIPISSYPHILMVDDIWTTGATLKSCAKVIKEAGAQEVWGLTLAR